MLIDFKPWFPHFHEPFESHVFGSLLRLEVDPFKVTHTCVLAVLYCPVSLQPARRLSKARFWQPTNKGPFTPQWILTFPKEGSGRQTSCCQRGPHACSPVLDVSPRKAGAAPAVQGRVQLMNSLEEQPLVHACCAAHSPCTQSSIFRLQVENWGPKISRLSLGRTLGFLIWKLITLSNTWFFFFCLNQG